MTLPKYFIYGLGDPRSGHLRYVGQSSMGLRRPRVHAHASTLKKNAQSKIRGRVIDQNGVIYESAIEATRILGLDRAAIYKVLSGERKTVKGYSFRWFEEMK